jgi:hypothetical protein
MINKTKLGNLCEYDVVFCDSMKALKQAYKDGLSDLAVVKTSSPSMLWEKKANIQHVEKRWSVEEKKRFLRTVKELSENIFDESLGVNGIGRDAAIVATKSAVTFQRLLYKAACLDENDFLDSRLFIRVGDKDSSVSNSLNSPWDVLLLKNKNFSIVGYQIDADEYNIFNEQKLSKWSRYKLAGMETLFFRLVMKIMPLLPDWLFRRKLLIYRENELIIDIASSLILKGVKVEEFKYPHINNKNIPKIDYSELYSVILPIMQKRVRQWVVKPAEEVVMSLFKEHIKKKMETFDQFTHHLKKSIVVDKNIKTSLMTSAPGNLYGQALSYVCNLRSIPLIAVSHGVTTEISKWHDSVSILFENSVSDAVFYYNRKGSQSQSKSHFDKACHHVVGASSRHIRMKSTSSPSSVLQPIVYISTNLYQGNIGHFGSSNTDYGKAIFEKKIVTKVLGKLPHKVLYKTYPVDNHRYTDLDPVLSDVLNTKNLDLFTEKIDMRYLISNYRILVTTCATSTLGWAVMSRKPVIFINQRETEPLAVDAYASLSKGLFVFDNADDDFHIKLKDFLSKPVDEIEYLWRNKEVFRKKMIVDYFSAYEGGAGARAAKIIVKEYLS